MPVRVRVRVRVIVRVRVRVRAKTYLLEPVCIIRLVGQVRQCVSD